jgi:hypothetical protein
LRGAQTLCYNFKLSADVAQLVEQLIRNEKVDSSIPFIGTINYAAFSLFSKTPAE